MIEEFLHNIREKRLLEPQQKVILTVSGGLDSMVMAHLFHMAGFEFGIAHCNFMLRGFESDEDAMFVSDFAKKIGAPFFIKSFNTSAFAVQEKLSIQVAARNLRYEWFESLIKETDFDAYATAHHFDDEVETFFINLFRGSGVSGLRGILPRNGNCIRPLLYAGRSKILKYALENKISYREDSSNLKDNYLRNRIRHQIIPAMEKSMPDFRVGMQNTFKILAGTERFILKEISDYSNDLLVEKGDGFEIALSKLLKHDAPDFVLFELLKPFGFNYSSVKDILNVKDGISGKTFLSSTYEIIIDRNILLLYPIIDNAEESVYQIYTRDRKILKPLQLSFDTELKVKGFEIEKNLLVAQLDLGKVRFPLTIRKFKEGDYFYPFGMKGRKKLSDFFIDSKFSIYQKRKIWLLLSEGEIVWVIGHRIDNRFRITENTNEILNIRII